MLLAIAPPASAALKLSRQQRVVMTTNWHVCDAVVLPLCQASCTPIALDSAALAKAVVAFMSNTSTSATSVPIGRFLKRYNAERFYRHAFDAVNWGHAAACEGQAASCSALQPACNRWTCPFASKAKCFGSDAMCGRYKSYCEGLGYSLEPAHAAGGVGPPADWIAPPSDWLPKADEPPAWPPTVRGAHPWMDELWLANQGLECAPMTAVGSSGSRQQQQEEPAKRWFGIEAVNDGWCDCADGADEPGTSACAGQGGRFWCALRGGKGAQARGEWISTALVDDGLCDCCDCSDEASKGGTQAAAAGGEDDVCAAASQVVAHSPPDPYVAQGAKELAKASEAVHEARLSNVAAWHTLLSEIEGIREALGEPPTDQEDYYHKQYLRSTIAMLSNAAKAGFVEPDAARELLPSSSSPGEGEVHDKHPLEYISLFKECYGGYFCAGGCTSHSEQYYWQLCPFRSAQQGESEEEGERKTSLGRFAGWSIRNAPSLVAPDANLTSPRATWEYRGGEPCHGVAEGRRVSVELRCAPKNELAAVDEDGKCRYGMVFKTPFACSFPWTLEEQQRESEAVEAARAKE